MSNHHAHYSNVARSEYVGQLQAWFDAVGRERILVVESESMYTDSATRARILEWLGLAPHDHEFPVVNESVRLDTDDPRILAELAEHFEPYNRKLFELLGYELWTGLPTSS